jgi:hypothetical protein
MSRQLPPRPNLEHLKKHEAASPFAGEWRADVAQSQRHPLNTSTARRSCSTSRVTRDGRTLTVSADQQRIVLVRA